MRFVDGDAVWGREVVTLLVAQVRLRSLKIRPVGLCLEAVGRDGHQVVADPVPSRFSQQLLDDPFALFVSALAELVVPDPPFRVRDGRRAPGGRCSSSPAGPG